MKLDRVMIAAPKSGSGKTTITCAILQTLKDMGKQVVSYKCGPDTIVIHPMFHLSSDHDIDHRQPTPRAFASYSASLNALSYIRIRHALILEDLCLCEV